jgi:hypothetical protein
MSILENSFHFLFVIFNPSSKPIFSSIFILTVFGVASFYSLKFNKKDYFFQFSVFSFQLKEVNEKLSSLKKINFHLEKQRNREIKKGI